MREAIMQWIRLLVLGVLVYQTGYKTGRADATRQCSEMPGEISRELEEIVQLNKDREALEKLSGKQKRGMDTDASSAGEAIPKRLLSDPTVMGEDAHGEATGQIQ